MNNKKYKFVWNKLLYIATDNSCKNCVFINNCSPVRSAQCYTRDIEVFSKYFLTHIYIKNEESSE